MGWRELEGDVVGSAVKGRIEEGSPTSADNACDDDIKGVQYHVSIFVGRGAC
jgi:hypothetical protein